MVLTPDGDGFDSSPSDFTDEHLTPTAITAAKPPVVTYDGTLAIEDGQALRATRFVSFPIASATGMEQLNNQLFYAQQCTDTTFALYDVYGQPIDATGYTAFINNGLAQFTLTGPSLYVQNLA